MRDLVRTTAVAAVLLLLIGTAVPLVSSGPTRGSALSGAHIAAARSGVSPSVVPPTPVPAAPNCSLLQLHFTELYPGLAVPPGVPGATFGGCPIGADDASVSLDSNGSGSAANATIALVLPPAGSATGTAYTMFSLRLAVSGVPCSLGGASVLSVELVPPESPFSTVPSANWTIRTPAFDLAPAGTCDPYCSNDTALVTLDGASFCEDEVLPSGFVPAPGAGVAPGSALTVTFSGTMNGASGLELWINDTSDPSANVVRTFGPASTSLGRPLEPLDRSAGYGRGLWSGTGPVSASWTDCPLPAGPVTGCNSYDPSFNGASGTIAIVNATFSGVSAGPSTPYSEVSTSSSTGGCSGTTPSCQGFDAATGSVYPAWGMAAVSGSAGLELGSGSGTPPALLGGPLGQFGDGGSAPFEPIRVVPAPIIASLPSATVSATLLDLAGISSVTYAPFYCSSSTTPSEVSLPAALSSGSSTDGVWNATLPIGSFTGTFPVAYSMVPSNGTPEFRGLLTTFTGPGGPACISPPTPPPTLTNVTATALGYRVSWNDSDPALLGVSLNASGALSIPGVFVPETWTATLNQTVSALLPVGTSGTVDRVYVTAIGLDGVVSPASLNLTAPPTLSALNVSASASPMPVVGPGRLVTVSLAALGGLPPYAYSIVLGNGAPAITGAFASNGTFSVALGTYEGTLDVRANVTDAAGDRASAPPVLVPVWTNPLGIAQSSQAGDGFVSATWGTPIVPGTPLVGYFIYSTTNASDAWRLASAGVVPGTFGGILVTQTLNHTLAFVVGDGSVLYAQVVGYAASGLGLLPLGNLTLVGRPAPFVVGPITSVGGGVAPFADAFSASVSGGSNDSLLSAVFSFPGFVEEDATISGGNGSFLVNVTYTFLSPGTFVVSLHVTDDEYDVGLVSTTVFVAPGVPPALSAAVLNSPAYNGTPVQFQAVATGGSGNDAFNWSFGDGGSASGSNPNHVYSEPGVYTAVVRATDLLTQGSNVTTFPVTIFTDPVVFVSVFPGPNGTDSFDFRASIGGGSGPSLVVWSFGDGAIAHGANATHDYDGPGTYTVNVTATDPAGHAGSTHYYLQVAPLPATLTSVPTGISPSLFWLVVALAAGGVLVAILIAVRRPPPVPAVPVGEFEEEDGAVQMS